MANANPARELAEMFEAWKVPHGMHPVGHRRKVAAQLSSSFAGEHSRAMRLLVECEAALDRLETQGHDVEHFRATVPRWQDALMSVELPWGQVINSTAGAPAIADDHVRMLRSLAGQLDMLGAITGPSPDTITAALQHLAAAEDFVKSATDVAESMRHYLLGLLAQIREALERGDIEAAGPRVAEFIGAVEIAATQAEAGDNPEAALRWRAMRSPWVMSLASSGAGALLGQAVRLITGG